MSGRSRRPEREDAFVSSSARLHRRPWNWFLAWLVVGGIWAFALISLPSVGLLVLPIALAATVLLARRSHWAGVLGLVSGLGLPPLYVAYLNRQGPGNICTSFSSGQSCVQEYSPWPWLTGAVLLITVGFGFFVLRYRD